MGEFFATTGCLGCLQLFVRALIATLVRCCQSRQAQERRHRQQRDGVLSSVWRQRHCASAA
jgi:hypothetical protein